ncbi:polysaccharide biosynthesis tyrosine autokinase [Kordia sp.]|uniref:exopolysaccharide transport family protein n=1 Tax=Kordia sp. TaxID=1965332 RepID=UPI003D29239F
MEEEFEELTSQNSFNIKAFALRALSYWYLFVITLGIAFVVTYFYNKRLQRIYNVESLISIKEEQNPFFSANTSLVFNWGGTSDKIETIRIILESRSHNEEIVRLLQSYVHYLRKGEYRYEDIYKSAPFRVEIDELHNQMIDQVMKIKFLNDDSYELSFDFEEKNAYNVINYTSNTTTTESVVSKEFKQVYNIKDTVNLPYLKFQVTKLPDIAWNTEQDYYLRFSSIRSEVNQYRNINVFLKRKGASLLVMSLTGPNRAILADYLNATAEVLKQKQLEQKNQFAVNIIAFIDEMMIGVKDSLELEEGRIKEFKQRNEVLNPSAEGDALFRKLTNFDDQVSTLNLKLQYCELLKDYLINAKTYSDLPAPASSGITNQNIVQNVTKIINLSVTRAQRAKTTKNAIFLKEIDRSVEATRKVLLESIITEKTSIELNLQDIRSRIARTKAEFRKLPAEEQELFNIQRNYEISQASYTMLLTKRNEAGIAKVSNVSDIKVIDKARDLGQAAIAPNTQKNFTVALFLGALLPLLFVFLTTILDNNIHTPDDLKENSNIPILGIIGRSKTINNLAVFNSPKSSVAESFRGIRSSLQYIYKDLDKNKSKTVMVTSSVSGEGKTFCSINIASVFSLMGKKTVLVGLDLRKPKIFDDFEITNDIGAVNYLIGQKTLEEVVQSTKYENLDIITSGPIPPNPSELLISQQMEKFMAELHENYDYVILDTPPLGLVSDAVDLIKYVDATMYLVRQEYTKKAMLNVINEKYRKKEITNISFVLNDFRQKAKYGYSYGYGYGYGNYGNGYHEDEQKSLLTRFKNLFKKS